MSRQEIHNKALNMAAGIHAAQRALTPEQLAIAERVGTGRMPCAGGISVDVQRDARIPGLFHIKSGPHQFRMRPAPSGTGAVRLEDTKAGGVWLQLGSKSMLMHQRLGSRLADECMSPAQQAHSMSLQHQPPPGLLDAIPSAKP